MFQPMEHGEAPTLGWDVADWIETYLAAPDSPTDYEPFILYPEQELFTVRYYEVRIKNGKRRQRRGAISRPRGWGKSPFCGGIAWCEALGPVAPHGWDDDGQIIGIPWAKLRTPLIGIAAVSEEQTGNTFSAMLEMGRRGPVVSAYPGTVLLDSSVILPRGSIECMTASARTAKGARGIFYVLDQTEEWVESNGGIRLARTLRNNAAKIGGHTLESPNAYIPNDNSVAEKSALAYKLILEGRTRGDGLYFDHREAPPDTDMLDRESLLAGLIVAYGDSADVNGGHVGVEELIGTIWDPDADAQSMRSDYLNQITHATDSWLSQPEWLACEKRDRKILSTEPVTLGFDGSRGRTRGVTDSTALIAVTVKGGHEFPIRVWEQPENFKQTRAEPMWRPPVGEVDETVEWAHKHYNVVGFYADPAGWESWIAIWEAKYAKKYKVKATQNHPIEWWMTGGRAVSTKRALEQFHSAVVEKELTHDGNPTVTRHILNARNRVSTNGLQIAKDHPDSPRKIDAAVAAVLAWQARLDALGKGIGKGTGKVRRIR